MPAVIHREFCEALLSFCASPSQSTAPFIHSLALVVHSSATGLRSAVPRILPVFFGIIEQPLKLVTNEPLFRFAFTYYLLFSISCCKFVAYFSHQCFLKAESGDLETEQYETSINLAERCLFAVASLLDSSPLGLYRSNLNCLLQKLLVFSPFKYGESGLSDEQEYSDEECYPDSSYRLRLAALNVLDAEVRTAEKSTLRGILTDFVPLVVAGLAETETSVRAAAFSTYARMITSGWPGGMKETTEEIEALNDSLHQVLEMMEKILRSNNQSDQIPALGLIQTISASGASPHYSLGLFAEIGRHLCSPRSKLRVASLETSLILVQNSEGAVADDLFRSLFYPCIATYRNAHLNAQALQLIEALFSTASPEVIFAAGDEVRHTLKVVGESLLNRDIDVPLLHATTSSAGGMIKALTGREEFSTELTNMAAVYLSLLNVESVRSVVLSGLLRLSAAADPLLLTAFSSFGGGAVVVQQVAAIPSEHRDCLEVMRVAVQHSHSSEWDAPSTLNALLKIIRRVSDWVVDGDLVLAGLSLRFAATAAGVKQARNELFDSFVPRLQDLTNSPLLQKGVLSPASLFLERVVVGIPHPDDLLKGFSRICGHQTPRAVLTNKAVCRAAILIGSSPDVRSSLLLKILESFGNLAITDTPSDAIYSGIIDLLTLGIFAQFHDLRSFVPSPLKTLLTLLSSPHREIRETASSTIGLAVLYCQGLPLLLSEFSVSNTLDSTLLLTALKEVCAHPFSHDYLVPYHSAILALLEPYASSPAAAARDISAQCAAALLASHTALSGWLTPLFSGSENQRLFACVTLRAGLIYPGGTDVVGFHNSALLLALEDESVLVCTIVWEIVAGSPNAFVNDINRLLTHLTSHGVRRPDLIRSVDLGPFKHTVDYGKPLRKAVAVALASLLRAVPSLAANPSAHQVVLTGLPDDEEASGVAWGVLLSLIGDHPEESLPNLAPELKVILEDTISKGLEKKGDNAKMVELLVTTLDKVLGKGMAGDAYTDELMEWIATLKNSPGI